MKEVCFEWDPPKSDANKKKHGRGFDEAMLLWQMNGFDVPLNINSGEQIWLRAGYIESKVWGAMFVIRGDKVRVVSFRRLNERERAKYGYK